MHSQSYTFEKSKRLLKPAEYQHVFSKKQKIYVQGLLIYFYKNEISHPRLGITIAKRNFKKAVDRNYIKRQVRESFRLMQYQLDHQDIIVVGTAQLKANQLCQVKNILDEIWRRLVVNVSLAS